MKRPLICLVLLSLLVSCAAPRTVIVVVTATPEPTLAPPSQAPATVSIAATSVVTSLSATPTPPPTETPAPSATAMPSASPPPADFILWDEAARHVGEETTLCGPVMEARFAKTSQGQPTFLNLGEKYPDPERFTVVIWGHDRDKFSAPPETLYLNHTVCVTGEIEEYEGALEIVVSDPEQIVIQD
jgi:hypothetical protein